MRRFAEGFLLPASFVALASTVQPAAAGKYCLQGRQWGYPGNCQFSTYRQCMATASGTDAGCETASGTDAGCGINSKYAFARLRGFVTLRPGQADFYRSVCQTGFRGHDLVTRDLFGLSY